ncbi:MAG: putative Quinone oxidoreductase [Hyphomicrobiales bacterium]|nr:putative Quinone oxidoreductase [Hyphomicrobiales bacterium]
MSDLPANMTAIVIPAPGGPEVLVPQSRPVPVPGEGEILIAVEAAGVNRPDVSQRQGKYPPPAGAPQDIPGLEIAGHVVACGPGTSRYKPGDQVCALVPGGGYAQYCTVHESNALPIPAGLSMIEAAAIPETFFTVWTNVFQRGRLEPGETLLVHGGSSGIGTTAIMLGKAFGAKVIVTVGSADKAAACLKLGADHAINYKTQDFVAEVKAITGGHGADVVLDMVGGSYVQRNYDAAAVEGRIVQIAFMEGYKIPSLDMRQISAKRLTHTGSTLRPRTPAQKAIIARELETRVWPLLATGKFRPLIDQTFDLAKAADAHARMETSAHIGKIVLSIGKSG